MKEMRGFKIVTDKNWELRQLWHAVMRKAQGGCQVLGFSLTQMGQTEFDSMGPNVFD